MISNKDHTSSIGNIDDLIVTKCFALSPATLSKRDSFTPFSLTVNILLPEAPIVSLLRMCPQGCGDMTLKGLCA